MESIRDLPDVDFAVNSTGITIFSNKFLKTPRFVPFDVTGFVDIDYVVQPKGVTLYCSRLKKARFVPFDVEAILSSGTFFRVKNKKRTMSI
jgi:hypothetical protein